MNGKWYQGLFFLQWCKPGSITKMIASFNFIMTVAHSNRRISKTIASSCSFRWLKLILMQFNHFISLGLKVWDRFENYLSIKKIFSLTVFLNIFVRHLFVLERTGNLRWNLSQFHKSKDSFRATSCPQEIRVLILNRLWEFFT